MHVIQPSSLLHFYEMCVIFPIFALISRYGSNHLMIATLVPHPAYLANLKVIPSLSWSAALTVMYLRFIWVSGRDFVRYSRGYLSIIVPVLCIWRANKRSKSACFYFFSLWFFQVSSPPHPSLSVRVCCVLTLDISGFSLIRDSKKI